MKVGPYIFIILSRRSLTELPDWLRQEPYVEAIPGIRSSDGVPVICMGQRTIVCTNAELFREVRGIVERARVREVA